MIALHFRVAQIDVTASYASWDGVKLGDKILYVDTFVDMLRRFPHTVQVNVISNSCYSGIFAEKFRVDSQQNR